MSDMEFHLDGNGHPITGSRWRHHSGVIYVVLMMTNVEPERQDKFPTSVVYQSTKTGKRYSRPLVDWLPKMEAVK
jgi:hypothetical protein